MPAVGLRSVAWALAVAALVSACGVGGPRDGGPPPEPYLLVWAGDADRKQSDFLAVVGAEPGRNYGKVLRTIPVKSSGNEPQDLNNELRFDRRVFATGLLTNRTFVFDLRDPMKGGLVHVDEPKGGTRRLGAPRAVVTLPGGRAAVACADPLGYRGEPREVVKGAGGLVVLGNDGRFVREMSAAAPDARGFVVAPGGAAIRPSMNVMITTNEAHGYAATTKGDLMPGITVQVWSLPALTVKKTVVLQAGPRGEENLAPRTPSFFRNRPFVLVNTREGGALYVSDSLGIEDPTFKLAFDFGEGSLPCGAAVTPDDRYYVTALTGKNQVVSLDLSDPWKPRRVSSVRLDTVPGEEGGDRMGGPSGLAMSLDGQRIAVSDYTVDVPAQKVEGDHRVHMLRLDRTTGQLRIDTAFRDEKSDEVGIDFDRNEWPHGATGPARPHGLLFVSPAADAD